MTDTDTLRKLAEAETPGTVGTLITFPKPKYAEQIVALSPSTGGMALRLFDAVDLFLDDDPWNGRKKLFEGGGPAEWAERFVAEFNSSAAQDAEIARLEALVEKMREALKPFGSLAAHFTNATDDGWIWRGEEPLEITVGDLRRAQEAGNE